MIGIDREREWLRIHEAEHPPPARSNLKFGTRIQNGLDNGELSAELAVASRQGGKTKPSVRIGCRSFRVPMLRGREGHSRVGHRRAVCELQSSGYSVSLLMKGRAHLEILDVLAC